MENLEDTGLKPQVIEGIRHCARRHGVQRVILYGSRARGEHRAKSDIDLAFAGGDGVRFALDVAEEVPTLLGLDLVDLDGPLSAGMRASVARDGRLIYEEV